LVEQRPLKAKVPGPIPGAGTILLRRTAGKQWYGFAGIAECSCEALTEFLALQSEAEQMFRADVAKLADACGLGPHGAIHGGSTPSIRTTYERFARVAQLVEHYVANVMVAGSNPVPRSILLRRAGEKLRCGFAGIYKIK
jgi:hypothetical protein